MASEINLPIDTGNVQLTITNGKCFGCRRNGGGMLLAEFDASLESDDKVPIRLCGNCLLVGMVAKVEHEREEREGRDGEEAAHRGQPQT